jgi:biofilm PGA synthesis N-glycosyltransferase PgaC
MATLPSYILITPARNEARYIELTLQSMAAQTYRPLKWIIVSDGSTDGTDDLVRKYTADNPWIELLRMPERAERHFAGKVHAFNAGYAKAKELNPDVMGNLDADVSIEPDHFQYLLSKFTENTDLGVGGSPFREGSLQYDYRFSNIENVWGGCQLFRRECFDAIGAKDYSFGNHPLWELFRTLYQMRNPPFALGGLALGAGYFWSMARRAEISVSRDLVAFTHREQLQRLKRFVTSSRNASPASFVAKPTTNRPPL